MGEDADQPGPAGPEQAGPEQAGPEQAGPEQAGPEQAGPEQAGPGPIVPAALLDRVPEGWTAVTYAGSRWGLSRVSRAAGRAAAIYAEQLGGSGVVSTNIYRLGDADLLRPCEMPAATVLDFLRNWSAGDRPGESVLRARDQVPGPQISQAATAAGRSPSSTQGE